VKCPDGSEKRVYRDVHDAFPLYIEGWNGKLVGVFALAHEYVWKILRSTSFAVYSGALAVVLLTVLVAFVTERSFLLAPRGTLHRELEKAKLERRRAAIEEALRKLETLQAADAESLLHERSKS
jgi:hypothetical protein